jgi:transcriptional regulator with XRE-family HTH domain
MIFDDTMAATGLPAAEIAKRAGMHRSVLTRTLSFETSPTAKNLAAMAQAVSVSACHFDTVAAGMLALLTEKGDAAAAEYNSFEEAKDAAVANLDRSDLKASFEACRAMDRLAQTIEEKLHAHLEVGGYCKDVGAYDAARRHYDTAYECWDQTDRDLGDRIRTNIAELEIWRENLNTAEYEANGIWRDDAASLRNRIYAGFVVGRVAIVRHEHAKGLTVLDQALALAAKMEDGTKRQYFSSIIQVWKAYASVRLGAANGSVLAEISRQFSGETKAAPKQPEAALTSSGTGAAPKQPEAALTAGILHAYWLRDRTTMMKWASKARKLRYFGLEALAKRLNNEVLNAATDKRSGRFAGMLLAAFLAVGAAFTASETASADCVQFADAEASQLRGHNDNPHRSGTSRGPTQIAGHNDVRHGSDTSRGPTQIAGHNDVRHGSDTSRGPTQIAGHNDVRHGSDASRGPTQIAGHNDVRHGSDTSRGPTQIAGHNDVQHRRDSAHGTMMLAGHNDTPPRVQVDATA